MHTMVVLFKEESYNHEPAFSPRTPYVSFIENQVRVECSLCGHVIKDYGQGLEELNHMSTSDILWLTEKTWEPWVNSAMGVCKR